MGQVNVHSLRQGTWPYTSELEKKGRNLQSPRYRLRTRRLIIICAILDFSDEPRKKKGHYLRASTVIATTFLSVSKGQFTDVVHYSSNACLSSGDLTRDARVAGRDVHAWVLGEEVTRTKEDGHWFGTVWFDVLVDTPRDREKERGADTDRALTA